VHDVAIQNVEVAQTGVYSGQDVDIAVSVKNEGTFTESFTVTLYCGEVKVGEKPIVNLPPKGETNVSFRWNTTGFLPKTYAIKASVDAVSNETDLSDNIMQDRNMDVLSSEPPASLQETLPYILIAAAGTASPVLLFALIRKRRNRGATRLNYLDKMLGGSIPPGSTILVLGNPGSGKSVLCQYLAHRFLNEGKACVFASYDEIPDEIRNRTKSFGWNLSEFEQKKMLSFIDCYSPVARVASREKHYVEQPFSLTDLSISISAALDEMAEKPKALFLDSATSLCTKLEIQRVLRFLQDRSAKIKASGDVFVFTLGKETIPPNFANRLEETVDGIIELDFLESQGKRMRRMRVKKLRGQEHLEEWVTFDISSPEAIVFLERNDAKSNRQKSNGRQV